MYRRCAISQSPYLGDYPFFAGTLPSRLDDAKVVFPLLEKQRRGLYHGEYGIFEAYVCSRKRCGCDCDGDCNRHNAVRLG